MSILKGELMEKAIRVYQEENGRLLFVPDDGKDVVSYGHLPKFCYTAILNVQPPKKKKIYQWLFQKQNDIFDTTGQRFGLNEREEARRYILSYSTMKEGGIFRPLMESEIEVTCQY